MLHATLILDLLLLVCFVIHTCFLHSYDCWWEGAAILKLEVGARKRPAWGGHSSWFFPILKLKCPSSDYKWSAPILLCHVCCQDIALGVWPEFWSLQLEKCSFISKLKRSGYFQPPVWQQSGDRPPLHTSRRGEATAVLVSYWIVMIPNHKCKNYRVIKKKDYDQTFLTISVKITDNKTS